MTPGGRKVITISVLVVLVTGALILKGFFSLSSGPSARRFHHRPAEAARTRDEPAARGTQSEPLGGAPRAQEPEARASDPRTGAPPISPTALPPARGAPAKTDRTAEVRQESEFILTPQTPEVVAAQKSVAEKLDGAVQRNPGNEVAFVDCAERPCRARAEAKDLESLTAFLRDVSSSYDGHLAVELRERLDPFMGRSFQADLLVGTQGTAAIPTEPSIRE